MTPDMTREETIRRMMEGYNRAVVDGTFTPSDDDVTEWWSIAENLFVIKYRDNGFYLEVGAGPVIRIDGMVVAELSDNEPFLVIKLSGWYISVPLDPSMEVA